MTLRDNWSWDFAWDLVRVIVRPQGTESTDAGPIAASQWVGRFVLVDLIELRARDHEHAKALSQEIVDAFALTGRAAGVALCAADARIAFGVGTRVNQDGPAEDVYIASRLLDALEWLEARAIASINLGHGLT